MIWFTADHHFGHKNVIQYCKRPFSDVEEMDEEMIHRWNEVVGHLDTVYHLGDLTLSNQWDGYMKPIFDRLHGHKYIVPGGHDSWIKKASSPPWFEILPSLFTVKIRGVRFVLCHYPMLSWDRSNYGSIHLHGHSHGTIPPEGKRMDVGVDTNNFYPYSLEEILERIK